VLVVDDDPGTCEMLREILEDGGYEVETLMSGSTVIEAVRDGGFDAVLLDLMMPGRSGIDICRELQGDASLARVPVIVVTALLERSARIEGLRAGALDFVTKPVDSVELLCRLRNLVRLKQMQDVVLREKGVLEQRVRVRTVELQNALSELESAYGRLRAMTLESIYRLTYAAEYRDESTGAHTQRIAHYARLTAKELGWPQDEAELLFYASPMHDIGKIGIPDSILLKPGLLTEDEFTVMRTHSEIGASLLEGSESPVIKMAERVARSHHEAWDGTGYPDRLRGEDIPYEARIVAIADVYDALRTVRPYKRAYSHQDALRVISDGEERVHKGKFEPEVSEAFLDLAQRMAEIYDEFRQAGQRPPVAWWLSSH